MSSYRKVFFLTGDVDLTLPVLRQIKHIIFPNGANETQWIVWQDKDGRKAGYTVDSLLEELGTVNCDGAPKVVVLRGLLDLKGHKEALYKMIPQIPSPNTLVLWDTNGLMTDIKKNDLWCQILKLCKTEGEVVEKQPPLNILDRTEQIRFIVDAVHYHNRRITGADADLLLELIGPYRSLLDSAIKTLVETAERELITAEDINESVVPMSKEYPQWMFAVAFNSGNYGRMMEAAERIVNTLNKPYSYVVFLAMQQARWQVVAAHCLSMGFDPELMMRKLSGAKEAVDVREKIMGNPLSRRFMVKEAFEEVENDEGDEPKTEKRIVIWSQAAMRDIVTIIKKMSSYCPPGINSPAAWVYNKSIERYMTLFAGMVDMREAGAEGEKTLFSNIMRSMSI